MFRIIKNIEINNKINYKNTIYINIELSLRMFL